MNPLRQSELNKLFEEQIERLKKCGCPAKIVEMLERKKESVIGKASQKNNFGVAIPFLPVIPEVYLSIYTQTGMMGGETDLEPDAITNIVKIPSTKPYYIFDVEDGTQSLGNFNKDAIKMIRSDRRRGLVTVELISICLHTNVVQHHGVDAVGTKYAFKDDMDISPHKVISMHHIGDDNGKPHLRWRYLGAGDPRWGIPSCEGEWKGLF